MNEVFNVNGKNYTEAELTAYLALKEYTNTPGWGVVDVCCCECGSVVSVRNVLGVYVCFECYSHSQKKTIKYCDHCGVQRYHNAKDQSTYCEENV